MQQSGGDEMAVTYLAERAALEGADAIQILFLKPELINLVGFRLARNIRKTALG